MSTQNDWEKRISDTYLLIRDAFWDEYLEHTTCDHDIGCVVTSDPIEKKVSLIMSTLLADARREVIEEVLKLKHTHKDCDCAGGSWHATTEVWECTYNDAIYDVLATLKEEIK